MGIISHLFNQAFYIYRIQESTSSIGEINPQSKVLVQKGVQGRITNILANESTSIAGIAQPMGTGEGHKQKLFLPINTDIKAGDFIMQVGNHANCYFVEFVNKNPGGELSHHYECTISSSTYLGS